jgi:hypothetical protein
LTRTNPQRDHAGPEERDQKEICPARANPCHILLVVSHHDNGILYGEADHVSPKELTPSPDTIVASITFPGSCVRTGGRVCAARRLCINIVARGLRENCPTSERQIGVDPRRCTAYECGGSQPRTTPRAPPCNFFDVMPFSILVRCCCVLRLCFVSAVMICGGH